MTDDFSSPQEFVVRIYLKPNGQMRETPIRHVNTEDRDWFVANDIVVSMEEMFPNQYATYACPRWNSDEDLEVCVLSGDKDCFETLAELRRVAQKCVDSGAWDQAAYEASQDAE